ncbi:uncharacterized protein [Pempheris klunzingeri]|uniref:uncharacterized protein isoform X2 n=1 Tax=Pempheris klunzingeri TaxID=3127111 RepID=UPI003980D8B1
MIMMLLLLLLGACVGMGLSHDQLYGSTYRIRLLTMAHSIEFTPSYSSDVTILWKHNDPPAKEDSRRKVVDYFFVMSDLTQRDSGRYVLRDQNQRALSRTTIDVIASTKSYTKTPGEIFSFTSNLESKSCNIYFFPESEHGQTEMEAEIVRKGRLQWRVVDLLICNEFDVLDPCGILNEDIRTSCRGRYEVRDSNGDTALVVNLEVDEQQFEPSYIGIGVGLSLAAICCRCCVKCCCSGKSSKKDQSETAEDEPQPAVHYQEYDREPAGPRPDELSPPSETDYPPQPSCTPTGPLIHNPPPVDVPPAYSEVVAPAEQADAPSVPTPQFELKGMTFPSAPLLNSDPSYCDVYTSDKLNFL